MITEFGEDITQENLNSMLTRSTFLGEGGILRNRHVENALIQANPVAAFQFSGVMQQSAEFAVRVLELDFGQICNISARLLRREDYAATIVAAFPVRLGWALQGTDAGLVNLLSRDTGYGYACLAYEAIAPGALVKLLHYWLCHPETVKDFPAHVSRAARNWESEFNQENALNNVRRALAFAQQHVSSQMVCALMEHIYKWERGVARLEKICSAASQHPWPTKLHLPYKIVRSWISDTVTGNAAVFEGLNTMKVAAAIEEGKDIRMTPAATAYNCRFDLVPREEAGAVGRLFVPTRQGLEEAIEGRVANRLMTTRSDTVVPDHFLFNPRFLSEFLSTIPISRVSPGTYNVMRPYSDEFGFFSSDSMFASTYTRHMLPAPDASEGTEAGFAIYELVSGFHMLLHGTYNFFAEHCAPVDLETEFKTQELLFICTFRDEERGVYVEAAYCHSGDRARLHFAQFCERCGGHVDGSKFAATRIKLDRWGVYNVLLSAMNRIVPYHKRNQITSLTRQIMRMITKEKHELQMNRHLRLLSAEIRSLANKMEATHTGGDTKGEPLFSGQRPIPYSAKAVKERFDKVEQARARAAEGHHTPKGYGRSKKAASQSEPMSIEEAADITVDLLFRKQLLIPEVSRALSGLIVRSKGMAMHAAPVDSPAKATPPKTERGTRILRLMFESDFDWAPILRRIAGYIYTPAFVRNYMPRIVQTQVVHQTRAQRKVRHRQAFIAFIAGSTQCAPQRGMGMR